MREFAVVLLLALLPAAGNFAGGLLAEFFHVSNRSLNWALHLAAGILLAVIGIELVPQVLETSSPWIVLLAFVAGSGFSVAIERAIGSIRARFGQGERTESAWMIYFGTAVDLVSDGLIIGTGTIIDPALGLLLALGQVPADVPEGFATIATLKEIGLRRSQRLLLSASFVVPILLGATVGYWAVRGQPDLLKFSLLAFAAGILLTVAVEEMITEAHSRRSEEDAGAGEVFALAIGFALFALLSVLFER